MSTALSSSVAARPRVIQRQRAAVRCRLVPTAAARTPAVAAAVAASAKLPRSGSGSLRGASWAPQQLSRQPAASRRSRVAVQARRSGSDSPDIADRVVASLPYLVPLLDSLRYGKFFLVQYPAAATVLVPLDPIIRLYFSFPFASLIVFFAIYLGIINNQNFTRYVRFNGMQAILLDIILIFPGLLESVFRGPPMGGTGLQLYISAYNTIFLFVFACVAYGVGSCLVGQTPRLPLVADAADAQVR